jgi:transcriptional regulator with XRE-family HTH domain
MLRVRQRLTQAALAARAGVPRRAVWTLECGRASRLRLGDAESILSELGARVDLRVLWNGPELDRMLDERHAALGAAIKRRIEKWGWIVRVEESFNHYGDRGRIDLLAFHPATGVVVVVELKTVLVDVQALLGSLDVKARVAPGVGQRYGWRPRAVIPAIVFTEDRTTRNRLIRVVGLFDRYELRGRAALSWLRRPSTPPPTGLLFLTAGRGVPRQGATQRVRAPRSDSKSAP